MSAAGTYKVIYAVSFYNKKHKIEIRTETKKMYIILVSQSIDPAQILSRDFSWYSPWNKFIIK